ncbi:MAG: 50S ribosomal protein L11, partial [Alphaproteobacteria bacterium]|nr:50S ribosomal protein L11 [Alphaproteobacteria bacterium]
PIPTVITAYADRTFTFTTKKPPVSYYLKKTAKVSKGSSTPGRGDPVAKITAKQVKEIAEQKMSDLNANDIEAACEMIRGSARSMNIEVVG